MVKGENFKVSSEQTSMKKYQFCGRFNEMKLVESKNSEQLIQAYSPCKDMISCTLFRETAPMHTKATFWIEHGTIEMETRLKVISPHAFLPSSAEGTRSGRTNSWE